MEGIFTDVSYIRARDPSIQNFNRERLRNARTNIQLLMNNSLSSDDSVIIQPEPERECEEEDRCIQVYLRVKTSKNKMDDYTINGNELICRVPEQPSSSRDAKDKNSVMKKYSFTQIFGPNSKQTEIFDNVVKIRVFEFINGNNSSLFTYGASGAGKTFTIVGSAEEPGLVPRALEYLFRTLPKLPTMSSVKPMPDGRVSRLNQSQQETELEVRRNILMAQKGTERIQNMKTYHAMQARLSNEPVALLEALDDVSLGIWVSFAEIYNEEIFDLLHISPSKAKQQPRLRIGMANNKVYIKDLTHVNVSNGLEAYQVFQYGIQKLKYAKTNVNNHSSRSHSVFSIKIAQALDGKDGVYVSAFNFCDLAGVERSKKTLNVGTRLKESNSINKSLLVLGRCIAAMRHSQKCPTSNQLIPFRESKLTQLFQKALSGFEDICMIVNINTAREMLDESHNVLNFSAMTKEILIQSQTETTSSRSNQTSSSEYLKILDEEVNNLEQVLCEIKGKYEQLVTERRDKLEKERKRLIDGWKEILEENRKECENKKKRLRDKYERYFEDELVKIQRNYKESLEKNKRKKVKKQKIQEKDLKSLQEKSGKQQVILTELKEELCKLNEEKQLVTEEYEQLCIKIEKNSEINCDLEKELEKRETSLFLRNEAECATSILQEKSHEINFISYDKNTAMNESEMHFTKEFLHSEEKINGQYEKKAELRIETDIMETSSNLSMHNDEEKPDVMNTPPLLNYLNNTIDKSEMNSINSFSQNGSTIYISKSFEEKYAGGTKADTMQKSPEPACAINVQRTPEVIKLQEHNSREMENYSSINITDSYIEFESDIELVDSVRNSESGSEISRLQENTEILEHNSSRMKNNSSMNITDSFIEFESDIEFAKSVKNSESELSRLHENTEEEEFQVDNFDKMKKNFHVNISNSIFGKESKVELIESRENSEFLSDSGEEKNLEMNSTNTFQENETEIEIGKTGRNS